MHSDARDGQERRRRVACGLFHFNIQYIAGNIESYHRYCTQAILPFLQVFRATDRYRASFELCGSGLEFLARFYSEAIEILRDLIDDGRIELISSTYAPTAWIAFPRQDLVRSVALNRECLRALRLRDAEIFFGQEAFFGRGVQSLAQMYPAALCKDDYLEYWSAGDESRSPVYRLGDLLVVVGGNHLLNELARQPPENVSPLYRRWIGEGHVGLASPPAYQPRCSGDVECYWYHMGSGHHLTVPAAPLEWERFHNDPAWTDLHLGTLDRLASEGFQFVTIREMVNMLALDALPSLPFVCEGSWNARRSAGVFAWMGRQESHWDASSSVLALASRSGQIIRRCERALASNPDRNTPELAGALGDAWKAQIVAESSDPLGWRPTPGEVAFGKSSAEEALSSASRLALRVMAQGKSPGCDYGDLLGEMPSGLLANFELPDAPSSDDVCAQMLAVEMRLVGAQGHVTATTLSQSMRLYDVMFLAQRRDAVLELPIRGDIVEYCPSAMEEQPVEIRLSTMIADPFCVPLTNGLVSLDTGLYLIRLNRWGYAAARISARGMHLQFPLPADPGNRPRSWRFLVVAASLARAVQLANSVNVA